MARPVRNRKICNPPIMAGFRPFGMPLCELEAIKLQIDEYESIKLVNYEGLPQEIAAVRMNVSRPTLTRVYNSALKKIAKAFVEGLAIEIEGGKIEFDKEWYKCNRCYKLFEGIDKHIKCADCPLYGKTELVNINPIKKPKSPK